MEKNFQQKIFSAPNGKTFPTLVRFDNNNNELIVQNFSHYQ